MRAVPTPLLHSMTNKAFDGDMVLVHLQERNLAKVRGG